jgi:uncharacterized protein YdaT
MRQKLDSKSVAFRSCVRETAPTILAALIATGEYEMGKVVCMAIDKAEELAQELNIKGYYDHLDDERAAQGGQEGQG